MEFYAIRPTSSSHQHVCNTLHKSLQFGFGRMSFNSFQFQHVGVPDFNKLYHGFIHLLSWILPLSDKFWHKFFPFTQIIHINLIWRVNFCKSMITLLKENNGILRHCKYYAREAPQWFTLLPIGLRCYCLHCTSKCASTSTFPATVEYLDYGAKSADAGGQKPQGHLYDFRN